MHRRRRVQQDWRQSYKRNFRIVLLLPCYLTTTVHDSSAEAGAPWWDHSCVATPAIPVAYRSASFCKLAPSCGNQCGLAPRPFSRPFFANEESPSTPLGSLWSSPKRKPKLRVRKTNIAHRPRGCSFSTSPYPIIARTRIRSLSTSHSSRQRTSKGHLGRLGHASSAIFRAASWSTAKKSPTSYKEDQLT